MSQKLSTFSFEWVESQSNEDFIQNYKERVEEGDFLEVDVQYPKKVYELHSDSPLLPERKKLEKVKK